MAGRGCAMVFTNTPIPFVIVFVAWLVGFTDHQAAAAVSPDAAGPLRSIDTVPDIGSYRIEALLQLGAEPPLQRVEVAGVRGHDPEREEMRFTVTERSGEPVVIESRRVDGVRYVRLGGAWAVSEKFHQEELIPITPDDLLAIANRLTPLETVARDGQPLEHRRGDRDDLVAAAGRPEADFARLTAATVDVWIDRERRYITELRIAGEAPGRDGAMPITFTYRYTAIGEPITVTAPDSTVADPPPPAEPDQEDVTRALGFPFPLPDGAVVRVYGATVSVVTTLPLAAARSYAARAMRDAGFVPGTEEERAPGEYYTLHERDGRRVGVLVFQVTDRGATIQVGGPR